MREYSEYVNSRWNEWNERYEIPFDYEFQLRTMFELEEQFKNQPKENVKTKMDILKMIQDIQARISRFKEKLTDNKIVIDSTGMTIIGGKIIYKNCDSCIFFSKSKENQYTCCRPSSEYPKFYGECNKDNNWQYYISKEIYKNIVTYDITKDIAEYMKSQDDPILYR